ncbi:MAG: hypothetical protein DRQ88_03440 [Epsilonproteobacteria bacterium]|nr:MAG: hypothetical protein DRQ89_01320 [Campylobacterota bacterium]RLA67373.1 MAG: hypothetical protein DRQ88_03440 [Campylobacterota bacterium]
MKNRKVTIFGMGVSGLSALRLLHREGADITVISQGKVDFWPNLEQILKYVPREKCYSQEEIKLDTELVILSPGISKKHPLLKDIKVPIWSEIELGFKYVDAPIIAITGTNGKTTTVTLLGEILNSMGHSAFVGGNIGIPLCDYPFWKKKAEYIVLELSSFQLEAMESFKSKVAAILNISQNHGERYDHFKDYVSAKLNITKNCESFLYTNEVPYKGPGKRIDLSDIEMDWDLTNFKIPGKHNLKNLYVIYEILNILGLDLKKAEGTLSSLSGVPFRMQYLESDFPLCVFNDAKSTNWDATLTAISSVEGDIYLILGGQKRGKGDSILPHLAEIKKHVNKVFLIGETTDSLAREIGDEAFAISCYKLETAIEEAHKESNGTLIFSPAFPSFDQFKNYVERGEAFSKLIMGES